MAFRCHVHLTHEHDYQPSAEAVRAFGERDLFSGCIVAIASIGQFGFESNDSYVEYARLGISKINGLVFLVRASSTDILDVVPEQ